MKYQKLTVKYKYILLEDETTELSIDFGGYAAESDYIDLSGRTLTVKSGYAWDGASGPTLDSACSMRASLVHDALYQLMRLRKLPRTLRGDVDKELYRLCIEDGMWKWRAKTWYFFVRLFAGGAAKPKKIEFVEI